MIFINREGHDKTFLSSGTLNRILSEDRNSDSDNSDSDYDDEGDVIMKNQKNEHS